MLAPLLVGFGPRTCEYCICCSILDIPVYNSLAESLHVLFTLYAEFKANIHFQSQLEAEGASETMAMG